MRAMLHVNSAQATYFSTSGAGNYGTLSDLLESGFIDTALASGEKYGYVFALTVEPSAPNTPPNFRLTATPRAYRKSGFRSFYIDADGEIRGGDRNGQPATRTDPLVDFDPCTNGSIPDNERCTISSLMHFAGAEATYAATAGNGNYGTLPELRAMNFINTRMATGLFRGYSFAITTTPQTNQSAARFKITAVPQMYGTTGVRSFFIDETGVIRAADHNGGPADQNDPPIN